MTEKLSKSQFRVLQTCLEVGGLFRGRASLWNWYRKYPSGAISKVSGNTTIEVLRSKGLLANIGGDTVAPTVAGRDLLRRLVGGAVRQGERS